MMKMTNFINVNIQENGTRKYPTCLYKNQARAGKKRQQYKPDTDTPFCFWCQPSRFQGKETVLIQSSTVW